MSNKLIKQDDDNKIIVSESETKVLTSGADSNVNVEEDVTIIQIGNLRELSLDNLTDVNISNPVLNQTIYYNGSEWVNGGVIGTGDMLKSVYDTDDDGVVDYSEVAYELQGIQADYITASYDHLSDYNNPHQVNKHSVGLGNVQNVDNTNADNITSGTLDYTRFPSLFTNQITSVVDKRYVLDVDVDNLSIIDSGVVDKFLSFDGSSLVWSAIDLSPYYTKTEVDDLPVSHFVNDAGYISDLSSFTTDDLAEGSNSLYSQWNDVTGGIEYTGGNVRTTNGNLYVGEDGVGDRNFIVYSDTPGSFFNIKSYGNYGGHYAYGLYNFVFANAKPGGYMSFYVNDVLSTPALYIKSNGNVGIGTTTPSEKLDVDGNLAASGSGTFGGTLNGLSTIEKGIIINNGSGNSTDSDFTVKTDTEDKAFFIDASEETAELNIPLSIEYTTEQLKLMYDSTTYSTFFTNSTGDLIIDNPTDKTVVLNETVWDDQQVSMGDIAGQGWFGNEWSDIVEYRSGIALRVADSTSNNYKFKFNAQLSHKYKEGEDIRVHVHVGNNSSTTGDVVLKITWEWASINGVFGNSVSETKTFTVTGTDGLHQVFNFSNSLSGVDKKVSSIAIANIERLADDSADTFSEDLYVIGVDYHIPIDTVGSRQEWIK